MRPLVLSISLAMLLLAACGYKGPLYLPESKPSAQQPAAPPAPQRETKKPGA